MQDLQFRHFLPGRSVVPDCQQKLQQPIKQCPLKQPLQWGSHYCCPPHLTGTAKQLDLSNAHRWARRKEEKLHSEQGLPWAERCHLQALQVKSSLLHLTYLINAIFAKTELWICASAVHWLQGKCLLQTSASNNIESHYDRTTWPDEIQVCTSPGRILIWIYSLHLLL